MPLIDLPVLLPRAIAWADKVAGQALARGRTPGRLEILMALSVGVCCPDRIRIMSVDRFPTPDDPDLRRAALATGLLGADGLGLTLGYAVLLRSGHEGEERLLRHEFRHVQQYERSGSLASFLTEYLSQIVEVGYRRAPWEEDARAHETESGRA